MSSDKTTTGTSSPVLDETLGLKDSKTQRTEIPRRNRSAFILFSLDKRKELKAQGQNASNSNQITVMIASLWKELGAEQKSYYEGLAKKEKEDYNEARKKCEASLGTKLKINRTKHNHVKKPCTCYGVFLRDNKEVIKRKYPTATMSQIMKIASKLWKNLDEETKKKYKDIATMEEQIFIANNPGFQRVYRKKGAKATEAENKESDKTDTIPKEEPLVVKKLRSEVDDVNSQNLELSNSPSDTFYSPEDHMRSGTELLDKVDFGAFNLDAFEGMKGFMEPRNLANYFTSSAFLGLNNKDEESANKFSVKEPALMDFADYNIYADKLRLYGVDKLVSK